MGLRDVNLIEPTKLLLSNEMKRKVILPKTIASLAFASRLHEKIKPIGEDR